MILIRTAALVVLIAISHAAWATPIVIQEVLYDAEGPDAPFAFTELVGPPSPSSFLPPSISCTASGASIRTRSRSLVFAAQPAAARLRIAMDLVARAPDLMVVRPP